jgi:dihydrofolate synthase/folylpolyglutamate synthase
LNDQEFERIVLNLPRSSTIKHNSSANHPPNYEIARQALEHFQVDFSSLKFVHVTGTNGKGSVCCKIANALAKSGHVVGLYTSPHLVSLHERIAILHDTACTKKSDISAKDLKIFGEKVLIFFRKKGKTCSFFDFLTIVAISFFFEKKVDVVVCEVGIGGRYDSTNFILPILSVITSISLDHQDLLGPSLKEIAWHKAGIIKYNVPVVLGSKIQEPVILEYAKKMQSHVLQSPLSKKDYDQENRETALNALKYLSKQMALSSTSIAYGLDQAPPGRYQKLFDSHHHLWILDVGHNYEGISRFTERVCKEFGENGFICVFSIAKDKDYLPVLPVLSKIAKKIFLVAAHHPRLEDPLIMRRCLQELGYHTTAIAHLPEDINSISLEGKETKLPILACGSFLLAEKILKNWR